MNLLYNIRSGLFIGFHGCDQRVRDQLLLSPNSVTKSTNVYDWLGTGFYIWEGNLERAQQWANEKAVREHAKGNNEYIPSVVGVVYDLGHCLDLMDQGCITIIKAAYAEFLEDMSQAGKPIPANRDAKFDKNKDKLLRDLDCAILNYTCAQIALRYQDDLLNKGFSDVRLYDTVRGCFTEGTPILDTQIYEKTHVQISIRNLNCIKGFFLPREELSIEEVLSEYNNQEGIEVE